MKKNSKIAFGSIIISITIALLFASSMMPFFKFSICAFCAALIAVVNLSFGGKFAFVVFLAASLGAFFVVPQKTVVVAYFLFIGYYPIVHLAINNKINNVVVRSLIKLLIFIFFAVVFSLLTIYLFEFKNKLTINFFFFSVMEYLFKFIIIDCWLFYFIKYKFPLIKNFLSKFF